MTRRLPRLGSSTGKFLVFAVVCLALLVALAVRIGNISLFTSRRAVYAQLADVTGLTSGDKVDVAGVQVGQVSGISVQRAHALVAMSLDTDVPLRRGTDVGLRWENVIGQKEVYLYPAHRGALLPAGATIPLSHDVSDASVDAFLNSLGPFLAAINPREADEFVQNVSGALDGDTAEIDQLLDSGAKVSSTVGQLDTQVGQVIGSLDRVLTAVASRSGDVGSLVANLQTVSQALASKNTVLDDVVGNLSQVSGELASLITQNHSTLNATIGDLETVTKDIADHQRSLAASLATLGSGLAPYDEISSYGQWFQVQSVYTCLANQTACTYYEPTRPPPGSGPAGSSPLLPSAGGTGGGTGAGAGTGSGAGTGAGGGSGIPGSQDPVAASSIPDVLGALAGTAGAAAGDGAGGAGGAPGGAGG